MKTKKTDGRTKNKGMKGIAGRKPIEDKKVNVSFYVKQSEIDKLGGKDEVRSIALRAIVRKLNSKQATHKK